MAYTITYLNEPYEVFYSPLWWHKEGLQETATGYGSKLTSERCVRLSDGRVRRIYITQFSNAGAAWITLNKTRMYLRG